MRGIHVFFLFCILAGACSGCNSSSDTPADVTGVWGVVISSASQTYIAASEKGETCGCNAGRRTSDPGAALQIWNLTQNASDVTVRNEIDGSPIASGTYVDGVLSLSSADGAWQWQVEPRKGGCCFDAEDAAAAWHAVKLAGEDGGCSTGLDHWTNKLTEELQSGSRVIETAAGPIEYAVCGERGPYLLFFHGGQGGYDQLRAFQPGLVDGSFRIISWSRPGYLRTPLSTGASLEAQAVAARALLDALAIDKVGVLGGSAGGPPLFTFALKYPERINALVAESAVSETYLPNPYVPYVQELVYLFENDSGTWFYNAMFEYAPQATARILLRGQSTLDDAAFDAWLNSVLADPARMDILSSIMRSVAPSALRAPGTENDLTIDAGLGRMPLAGISAPTLVVHGTNDGDVSPDQAVYTAAAIPGARLRWVPGGSHLLGLSDQANLLNAEILAFLAEHAQ
jgi:pimeloyl-ACP methyl ester carboxylesterase